MAVLPFLELLLDESAKRPPLPAQIYRTMLHCAHALAGMNSHTLRLTTLKDSITIDIFLWESFLSSHPSETRWYDTT